MHSSIGLLLNSKLEILATLSICQASERGNSLKVVVP